MRKFFYENSAPLEDLAVFCEIKNARIAKKVGIESKDQIVVVQNQNPFHELGNQFNILNLDLEKSEPIEFLTDQYIKDNLGEHQDEFSKIEFETELMFSENENVNLYSKLLSHIETVMNQGVQYGSTQRSLKFLKTYSRKRLLDLLFVQEKDTQYAVNSRELVDEMNTIKEKEITARMRLLAELQGIKRDQPEMQVVYTDLKEAHQAFNILPAEPLIYHEGEIKLPIEARLIRYGQVFNDRIKMVY